VETYSRIGLLRRHSNLQSYSTTLMLWHVTVVLKYFDALAPYGRIELLLCSGTLRSYPNVRFDMSPLSTFSIRDRKKASLDVLTFEKYVWKRYGLSVENQDQPLLECYSEKKGEEVFLIPELCQLTGARKIHSFRVWFEVCRRKCVAIVI
jgi:hypothetical protein